MSKEQFDLKQAEIEAIADDAAVPPAIPVDTALQEAENLNVWCQADKDKLVKAGLDWSLVDDLDNRAGALRYIQSIWKREYRSQEEAQKLWKEKAPAAFELRDELLHHSFHAYYGMSDLYAKVQAIAEGNGNADMIQDLSDLAELGKANTAPLEKINMDLSLLDAASASADEMSELLAQSNGKKKEDNKTRLVRDKAYAFLKLAVDEIRRQGQYVFYRDENRKKGYISDYYQLQAARAIKAKAAKKATT